MDRSTVHAHCESSDMLDKRERKGIWALGLTVIAVMTVATVVTFHRSSGRQPLPPPEATVLVGPDPASSGSESSGSKGGTDSRKKKGSGKKKSGRKKTGKQKNPGGSASRRAVNPLDVPVDAD